MKVKNAAWVVGRLRKRFPDGTFAFLEQVRNGTGFTRKTNRYADALVVSCWPSRGRWLGGIEVKVSLSDWRKEVAQPKKADAFQRYCKYWWVAAPKGVVPIGEVPETWGLLECTERGVEEAKPAPATECDPVDLPLVASICRGLTGNYVSQSEHRAILKREREGFAEQAKQVAEAHRTRLELDALKETIAKFEQASGVSIGSRWSAGDIGEAVQDVTSGRAAIYSAKSLRRIAQKILHDLSETGVDE